MASYMTEKQQQIYDFIKKYLRENQRPPTVQEIGDAIGKHKVGVWQHLQLMRKKGYIKITPNIARGIELL